MLDSFEPVLCGYGALVACADFALETDMGMRDIVCSGRTHTP